MKVRRKLAGLLIGFLAATTVLAPSALAGASFISGVGAQLGAIIRSGSAGLACVESGSLLPAIHTTIPLDRATGKDLRPLAKIVDFDMNGLTTVEMVRIGARMYVFGYRSCDGVGFVRVLNEDGTLGNAGAAFDWTTGWTSIEPYQIANQTFIFQAKSSDGTVAISRLTADAAGTVTITELDRADWTSGWTHDKPFAVAAGTFLLNYKKGTGEVAWNQLTSAGKYVRGEALPRTNIGTGWTQLETYNAGTKTFLLMSNRSTGAIKVREVNANGSLGAERFAQTWSTGWDSAHVFDAGTNKYVVMSKSNGDRVMVRRIDGGTIGAATTDFPWDYLKMIYSFGGVTSVPDYQHINFTRGYSIGTKTYVLTVASEKLTDFII